MARSYLRWGGDAGEGRPGAIAVLKRGSDPSAGHVGFVVGETDDHIILLGGNQSDSVSVARYPKIRLLGLRWPAEAVAASPEKRSSVFDVALEHVLEMEGGFTDDPHDPGGPTNKGITLRTYAAYLGKQLDTSNQAALLADLKLIPTEVARAIYKKRYWQPSRAGEMPSKLALMHFDASVNHGVGGASRMLQQALDVTVDGAIGPITLAAARQRDSGAVIARYAEIRRGRYRGLSHFWRFGRGWLRRVDRTLERARALGDTPGIPDTPDTAPQISTTEEKGPQMDQPQQNAASKKWWGSSMTIWGAAITALSTVLPAFGPALGIDITPELVRQFGEQSVGAIQAIGGVIGTIMTIYGRSRAAGGLARREMRLNL